MLDLIHQGLDILLHLDAYLNVWIGYFGPWIYVILFLIIFCETGLVVTPILPGDSLLFALGALSSSEKAVLSLPVLCVTLVSASIIGDNVNYFVGNYIGPKIFHSEDSLWLNKKHLLRTQEYYERHGGKTVILARFMPIIRTFAPFVAGVGKMDYRRYVIYVIVGSLAWINLFLLAGHFFGNIPSVKQNFHVVIFAIIIISFLPVMIEFFKHRFSKAV